MKKSFPNFRSSCVYIEEMLAKKVQCRHYKEVGSSQWTVETKEI